MPSSNTMLAHEPSQVPENCAIAGKWQRLRTLSDRDLEHYRVETRFFSLVAGIEEACGHYVMPTHASTQCFLRTVPRLELLRGPMREHRLCGNNLRIVGVMGTPSGPRT